MASKTGWSAASSSLAAPYTSSTASQATGRLSGRAGTSSRPSISAMPPNWYTAQGVRLPSACHTHTLSRPSARLTPPATMPARSLTRVATASPINPAKATDMP